MLLTYATSAVSGTTFDPSAKAAAGILSNGNLTLTSSTSAACALATVGQTSGQFYFEFHCGAPGTGVVACGVQTNATAFNTDLGQETAEYGYRRGGQGYLNGVYNSISGSTWTTGDVIGVAVDFTAKKLWFAKNNTWQASGNPAAGTAPWATYTSSSTMYPAAQTDSGGIMNARFTSASHSYSPPAGFTAYG